MGVSETFPNIAECMFFYIIIMMIIIISSGSSSSSSSGGGGGGRRRSSSGSGGGSSSSGSQLDTSLNACALTLDGRPAPSFRASAGQGLLQARFNGEWNGSGCSMLYYTVIYYDMIYYDMIYYNCHT